MKRNLLTSMLILLVFLAAPVKGFSENLAGGWEIQENTAVTEEASQALEKAAAELTDEKYEPVALLASQVVAGTNYCILCRITPAGSEAAAEYGLVYVYAGVDGTTEILGINKLQIGLSDAAPAQQESGEENEKTAGEATMGERNALSKAEDYLSMMAFSYSGLIQQLEFEGFSEEEATYAADHCGADWKEQAAKKAEDYLDIMSFSRSGLIDQLEYEGFTKEQAEYGADAVGY